jgi:hypothetical protein
MKIQKRVTAYIQDDESSLVRQGRLVEEGDIEAIDRVFKMFNIQYEADEIPANSRLYSLTLTMPDRYISDNMLTQKELTEHISAYVGKKNIIAPDELKKLVSGKVPQIYKNTSKGEILIGYELTIKGDKKKPLFSLSRLKFGSKKAAKPA